MTYLLAHVESKDGGMTPCVVREADWKYLTLNDANILIELKELDGEAYAIVMALARKFVTSGGFRASLNA